MKNTRRKRLINSIFNKFKNSSVEVRASISYTICNVLQRSLSFITLPIFTRMLTTEQYGQSTVYSSWESLVTLFITLNLAYGSFSTAMVKFEDERGKYISAINGLCTTLAMIFLIVYIPLANVWNRIFELPTFIIVFMIISIIFGNSTQLWYGKERFEYGYKKIVAVTLLTTILSPIITYVLVSNTQEKGYAKIIGMALCNLIVGILCYMFFLIKERNFYNRKFWKYALKFNIPLIPYYLSQTIFNQSDRIMISHISGQDKAAIYGVAYTLGITLTIVLNAINSSYTPWFYGRLKDGRRSENKKISNGIAAIMAFLLLGVIAVAPEIIYILASPEYVDAIWVVPPVAMSLLFLFYTQLFVNFEFYFEEKKMLVFGTVLSALINIVLNLLLIPVFGFVAAGYTTLFSYIVFVLMHHKMYKKLLVKYGISDDMFDYKTLIVIAIAFMVCGFCLTALYKYFVIRYLLIVAVLIIILVNRKKC